MPRLTRWYLRSALLYLVLALLVALLLAARPLAMLPPALLRLQPTFFHLFMVGWVTQLIFGVVYWMFPKYSREQPHRSETLAWSTFILLNLGLLLRVIAEPLHSPGETSPWGFLLALSALLQWFAGVGFVINTWSRVKVR